MMKMKDSRLTEKNRTEYKEQKHLNNCWNSEIKNDLKELNMDIPKKTNREPDKQRMEKYDN